MSCGTTFDKLEKTRGMKKKLEIFPLKVQESLILLYITMTEKDNETLKRTFELLEDNNIMIHFLTEGPSEGGNRNVSLALHRDDFEKLTNHSGKFQLFSKIGNIRITKEVGLIRILGAHFDIRPGIASILFNAMRESGIEILANSTTITSSLILVREKHLDLALRAIQSVFKSPGAE